MKGFLFVCLLALVVADVWVDYKNIYNRKYTAAEETHRRQCFFDNLKRIDERNALRQERHGINSFTDICPEEFKATHHNLKITQNRTYNYAPLFSQEEVARARQSNVDWRTKGAVTPIKNQAQCGSCWAFSTTGNIEGQWFLAGHPIVALSEQELVSCSHNGNNGCSGGLMDNAFTWIVQNGGITSEANYPYTSGGGNNGICQQAKVAQPVAKISGHVDVQKSEDQMAAWVSAHGPLSVAVDAAAGWQTYHGGVVTTCRGRQLDHGVLAVGYTADYWIVKNSWGPTWGEQGYIRLQKGTNQCGINMMPSSSQA